jgi:hypothetical protein
MDATPPGAANRSQRRRFWTGFTGFTGLRSDQAILVLLFRNPVHPVHPVNFVPKMNDSPVLQRKRTFVHAVQYERSVHSRKDFTTDFADFTDGEFIPAVKRFIRAIREIRGSAFGCGLPRCEISGLIWFSGFLGLRLVGGGPYDCRHAANV